MAIGNVTGQVGRSPSERGDNRESVQTPPVTVNPVDSSARCNVAVDVVAAPSKLPDHFVHARS